MDSRRKQGRSRWLLVMVLSFAAMAVTIVKIRKKYNKAHKMPKAMQRVTPAASPFLSVRHVPRQDSKTAVSPISLGILLRCARMDAEPKMNSRTLQNLYMDLMQSGLRRKYGIGYIVL